MKDVVDIFKGDLEKLMDDWYAELDHLVDGAMLSMSFFEGEPDEHFAMLLDVMFEVLQERLGGLLGEDGESE